MSDVKLIGVKKSYGHVSVLHGIDIEIADGEFTILVGPSGCGKSTLLRMIAGLEDISEGEIVIDGRVVNTLEPKDRDIAMVFQNYALYPQMTVAQNMGFALEMAGWKKPAIAAKVREAAAILGLEPLLDRKPSQLSGGQRQRVAMGRAIVRDPKVFLFDEPLSNLDAKLRVQMRTEIKALHQRLKTTIVYVTHDQIEAMTMADKIVVMHGGHVEQIGHPLHLYDQPANLFVAGFLGSPAMNFLPGRIRAGEAGALALEDGTSLPLGPVAADLEGRTVVLGIRPEKISIGGADSVPARVVTVDPTGAETHLAVEIGGKPVMAVVHDRVHVAPDDSIDIALAKGAYHLFDPETQLAIH